METGFRARSWSNKDLDPEKWKPVFAALTFGSGKIMVKQEDKASIPILPGWIRL
ncbi:hypothetical protein [Mesorhizobium sp. AA22]|uniref:hypothetical protein n=1 Tax=Mesorhizobium sp. AA22 TaxID=1854057 RepID=UPI00139857B8|nr:hypothetical protein [Mesorhizobium sp. AA22]QIA22141.1 hypothetical protein A9K68_010365 [Mesorhizobium sp. AA22]